MAEPLPRWDVSGIYPSLDSAAFRAAFDSLVARVTTLRAEFDRLGVRAQSSRPDVDVPEFEALVGEHNARLEELRTLAAYVSAYVSTNSHDDLAQARDSE